MCCLAIAAANVPSGEVESGSLGRESWTRTWNSPDRGMGGFYFGGAIGGSGRDRNSGRTGHDPDQSHIGIKYAKQVPV